MKLLPVEERVEPCLIQGELAENVPSDTQTHTQLIP